MKVGKTLWACSLGAAVAQAAWAYPSLPEKFASHFDGAGNPNGWSGKGEFYVIWLLCVGGANVIPLTVGWLLRGLPASMINLPRKDYWLATPERRERAIEAMQAPLCWFLFFINLILLMAFNGVFQFAKGGKFEFSLAFFIAMLAAAVVSAVVGPFVTLRVPASERQG